MGIGGADVSGSKIDGQASHASLLLGDESKTNRIYNKIGVSPIHMRILSDKDRKQVIRNLNLSSNKVQCWCFHINREQIEKELLNHSKLKKYRTPKINIHKNFDMHWLRTFHGSLNAFLASQKNEISDVVVQTDLDTKYAIKAWGMQSTHEGKAYELADAVAWCNQKGIKIKGCEVMDVREEIRKGMYRDLLKG